MPRLFVSYSHQDQGFVEKLVTELRTVGAELWIDTCDIRVGDSLIDRIRQGIDSSDYVGAVISKASITSAWVQRELDIAMNHEIDGRRVVVLPILIDEVELPGFLLGKAFADFRHPSRYQLALSRLAARLNLVGHERTPLLSRADEGLPWNTIEARRIRGALLNQMGMKLLEWSAQFDGEMNRDLLPESWRRRNDGATYAWDSGDGELYERSLREMRELEKQYAKIMHLYSNRGLVLREATRLFRHSAACGDPEGFWNLAWRCELGQGTVVDHELAIFYWSCAARLDHGAARARLREIGVHPDDFVAARGHMLEQLYADSRGA